MDVGMLFQHLGPATEKARSSKQVFYFQTFTLPLISDCRRAPALHVAEWMQLHKPTCMYIDVDFEGKPGVTGPIISPAGLYPGILWPIPIHTPQAKLYTHDINHDSISVERYTQELFNFSTSC